MSAAAGPGPASPEVSAWAVLQQQLRVTPRVWLVTGAAGFIGSHLLETLLDLDQQVVALDNFATGFQHNLDEVARRCGAQRWARCHVVEGDIRDPRVCAASLHHPDGGRVDHVLHQAALGSVPRSLKDPAATHEVNVTGFLNLLIAARDAQVASLVYASSSSVYGDHPGLPKVEAAIGHALSPYAVSKRSNELYADVFARSYGLRATGLRYFNVFGPRQDPHGAYAAVIPVWTAALLRGDTVWINGDGETSRDFCYVANAVQANLLAAVRAAQGRDSAAGEGIGTAAATGAAASVYNVAVGERSTLNQLFASIRDALAGEGVAATVQPSYRDFRAGDVRHSLADIGRARAELGYAPTHTLAEGLQVAMPWYAESLRVRN